jgi:NhaP-type Na+/H+ or K+/H+ antiporter
VILVDRIESRWKLSSSSSSEERVFSCSSCFFIAVFAGAARRLRVPYPILLTIIGGILGTLPVFPNVALEPNLIFFVFLPPLLFAAGWQLSWREFQAIERDQLTDSRFKP